MKVLSKKNICFTLFFTLCELSLGQIEVKKEFLCDSLLIKPYGITSHITWKGYDYDSYEECIDKIHRLGINYLRTDFNFTGEKGIAAADLTIWDNVARASKSRNMALSSIVCPYRYSNYTGDIDNYYRNYLEVCADRYNEEIRAWEIWNEMDLMFDADGKVSAREYIPLLKSSYNALKSFNKKNVVVLGSIGNVHKAYFEEILKYGAADYYDITNIHYYSGHDIPEAILPFYTETADLLSKYKVNKPLWLTETGYSTYSENDNSNPDIFYSEILPKVYDDLGIRVSNKELVILFDNRIKKRLKNQDNPAIYTGFKGVRAISLDEIQTLDIKSFPIVMVLFGEWFPMAYFSDLEDYIRRGGTVVFPEGGALLYYDLNIEDNTIVPVGKSYYKRLHIDCMFAWEIRAKSKGVKSQMEGIRLNSSIKAQYSWENEDLNSPKYYTDNNLSEGDKLMPIIEGYDNSFSGPVAVCYNLNSDLKGNIIIQARDNNGYRISESLQAIRYPRLFLLSFAVGVDKVFAYCLSERGENGGGYGLVHKDHSVKPAYNTLKVLINKLPDGSSRPHVIEYNGQYIASWITPKGKKMYAVWADKLGVDANIKILGRPRFYDSDGKRRKRKEFAIMPDVVYIENAQNVSFE